MHHHVIYIPGTRIIKELHCPTCNALVASLQPFNVVEVDGEKMALATLTHHNNYREIELEKEMDGRRARHIAFVCNKCARSGILDDVDLLRELYAVSLKEFLDEGMPAACVKHLAKWKVTKMTQVGKGNRPIV